MKLRRPNQDEIVKEIAKTQGISMATVKGVIQKYQEMILEKVPWSRKNSEPTLFGVLPIDSTIKLNHGATVIYGHESIGKTSLAKRIAISSMKLGLNVIYWDAENKIYLHDMRQMKGLVLANSRMIGDLKAVLRSTAVDMLVIDTVTSMEERTSFIRTMLDFAPFLILVTQMKSKWGTTGSEPACYEPTLSTSHTKIHLTGREKITIESLDMFRVQYKIDKYEANPTLVGERGSFIIKDGIVDNIYSAYDYFKARGRISSLGFSKALDKEDLGGRFREVCYTKDIADKVISAYWGKGQPENKEIYIDEYLRPVQDKKLKRRRASSTKLGKG